MRNPFMLLAASASLLFAIAGCNTTATTETAVPEKIASPQTEESEASVASYAGSQLAAPLPFKSNAQQRECLMRAMYFESIRSSQEGLLAVGTVVMNRVESPKYPSSVCAVVGQKNQFAPGVMTRSMQGNTADLSALADSILNGKRHPKITEPVMFFHTAGLKFPYKNMRYVHVAGGNSFYYKASRR